MAEQLEQRPDDRIVRLAYEVRDLVQAGKYAKMQQRVEHVAEQLGMTPWDLTRQLAEIGFEKHIATPIQLVAEGELDA